MTSDGGQRVAKEVALGVSNSIAFHRFNRSAAVYSPVRWYYRLRYSRFQGYCSDLRFNTLRPRQSGRHFAGDTPKHIFLNENVRISTRISLKFAPKGPINHIPSLIQIIAWRRSGEKPLSETMAARLPTHICVTRPQSVNGRSACRRNQFNKLAASEFKTELIKKTALQNTYPLFFRWVKGVRWAKPSCTMMETSVWRHIRHKIRSVYEFVIDNILYV